MAPPARICPELRSQQGATVHGREQLTVGPALLQVVTGRLYRHAPDVLAVRAFRSYSQPRPLRTLGHERLHSEHLATAHPSHAAARFEVGRQARIHYVGHSRDVSYATFCQGPYEESSRYRDFMGWTVPWYSVPQDSVDRLIADRHFGILVSYLRDDDQVYETYWTTGRGNELMAPSYGLLEEATARW
jgi:Bacterial protein of unknown function (DUF899)